MERNTTLSTVLQVLTLLVSLVSAIGVLILNSKVDRLTGQVEALQQLLGHTCDESRHALQLTAGGRGYGARGAATPTPCS